MHENQSVEQTAEVALFHIKARFLYYVSASLMSNGESYLIEL